MNVPLVDLSWQHREIADDLRAGFERVFEDTSFILGAAVAEFEGRFARFMGVQHCVGVGSGTDALELALRALGIGAGDEVVVPAHTFVASGVAVLRAGAKPVFADVDPETLLLDPASAEAACGEFTRAIMPVHLYGQAAAMDALGAIAARRGLKLLEDAAQSQGARQADRPVGSLGHVAATSFYPGKNIGAYGDAGALLTSDATLAQRLRRLGNLGSDRKYEHPELGFNSRLDTLQAVVLLAKLGRLAQWNELRRQAAARYDAALGGLEALRRVASAPDNEHVFHLYVVRVPERDRVLAALNREGIGAGVHYPTPMHLHGAFAPLGHSRGDFPIAEAACDEILSLPLYPGIEASQQDRVVEGLRRALG